MIVMFRIETFMMLLLCITIMCFLSGLYGHAKAEVRFEDELRKSYEENEDLYSVIHNFRAGIGSAGAAHPSGSRPIYLKPIS
jgi:hypothetical protein